jgi:hypothetical protein
MISARRNRKNILRRLRAASSRLGSCAMIMVMAVWLNMAIQPCLMAAEPLLPAQHHESGCPHCPPAQAGHCGDEGPAGRCAFIESLDFDGRQAVSHAGTDVQPAVMMLPLPATIPVFTPEYRCSNRSGKHPPAADPPLFIRNCSFLK